MVGDGWKNSLLNFLIDHLLRRLPTWLETIPRFRTRNQSVENVPHGKYIDLLGQMLFIPGFFGRSPLRIRKLGGESTSLIRRCVPPSDYTNVEIIQFKFVTDNDDICRIYIQVNKRDSIVSIDTVHIGQALRNVDCHLEPSQRLIAGLVGDRPKAFSVSVFRHHRVPTESEYINDMR